MGFFNWLFGDKNKTSTGSLADINKMYGEIFRHQLSKHVEKIVSEDQLMGIVVGMTVNESMIDAIAPLAQEKMQLCQSDGKEHSIAVKKDETYIVLSVVPWAQQQYQNFLQESFGGYLKYLDGMCAREDVLKASFFLAISYGDHNDDSWVNMALMNVSGEVAPVVLPSDFLTSSELKQANERWME